MRSINWRHRTHYFSRGCRRCLPYPNRIKKPYAFATRDTTLVLTDIKDKIISLTVLLKDCFVFENNLWRVPLWTVPIHEPAGHTVSTKVLIKSGTTNCLPVPRSTVVKISNLYQLLSILSQQYSMMVVVVVRLFIDTQNRLVVLHSALFPRLTKRRASALVV